MKRKCHWYRRLPEALQRDIVEAALSRPLIMNNNSYHRLPDAMQRDIVALLHRAIRFCDCDAVTEVLQQFQSENGTSSTIVNVTNGQGQTALDLLCSVAAGHPEECCRHALQRDIAEAFERDVAEAFDRLGDMSSEAGYVGIIAALRNVCQKDKRSAIGEVLIAFGATVTTDHIIRATLHRSRLFLELLIRQTTPEIVNGRHEQGWTALQLAVAIGSGYARQLDNLEDMEYTEGFGFNSNMSKPYEGFDLFLPDPDYFHYFPIRLEYFREFQHKLLRKLAQIQQFIDDGDRGSAFDRAFRQLVEIAHHCCERPEVDDTANGAMVSALIRAGSDVNLVDNHGSTPLFYAAAGGHREILKTLIHAGSDVNLVNNHGFTPLFYAGVFGNLKIMKTLLHAGANPNIENQDLMCPLLLLAVMPGEEGYPKRAVVKLLLQAGAHVDATDALGNTCLHCEAYYGCNDVDYLRVFDILMRYDADLEARNHDLETPLHRSVCDTFHGCCVKELLAAGSNVNVQNKHGLTPLHYAARNQREDEMQMLLQAGANLDQFDNKGMTALMHATKEGWWYGIQMLLQAGANLDQVDDKGMTALMHAATTMDTKSTQTLLQAGANVRQADNEGVTALMHAAVADAAVDFLAALIHADPAQLIAAGACCASEA